MITEFKTSLIYKSNDRYERLTKFKYDGEEFSLECSFERLLEFIKILQSDKVTPYQRIKYTRATK